jgi:hypothetical protein
LDVLCAKPSKNAAARFKYEITSRKVQVSSASPRNEPYAPLIFIKEGAEDWIERGFNRLLYIEQMAK